jgi:hypothetical protein
MNRVIRLNATILAANFNYPESEVRAIILAGGLPDLFPTGDPDVPAVDANGLPIQVYASEMTYNIMNGASIAINDARSTQIANYESAGMQTIGGPRFSDCPSMPIFEGTFGYNMEQPDMNATVESYVDDGLAKVLALSSIENARAMTAYDRLLSTVPLSNDQRVVDATASAVQAAAVADNVKGVDTPST